MELLLIRHTRTAAPEGTCYGRLDVALADTHASDIVNVLRCVRHVDRVFSSPSQRCAQLALALAQRDACPLHYAEALQELNFGAWEGRAWRDVARAQSDPWAEDPWLRAPPGGETEASLWQRVADWRERHLSDSHLNELTERIAIIAHGGSLRALRCQLLRLAPQERWQWQIAYGECQRLEFPTHHS